MSSGHHNYKKDLGERVFMFLAFRVDVDQRYSSIYQGLLKKIEIFENAYFIVFLSELKTQTNFSVLGLQKDIYDCSD